MMVEAKKPFGVYVSRGTREAKRPKPLSRFDGRPEPEAPGGIPRAGQRGANIEIAHVNVEDPNQDEVKNQRQGKAKARLRVAANVRASILDWERSRDLIDDEQYRVGQKIEAELAIAGGSGGNSTGVRLDPGTRKELAIAYGIDRARRVEAMLDDIRAIVGTIDLLILRRVLGDRWPYEAVASELGRSGTWGARFIAARYRDALALLAREWAY